MGQSQSPDPLDAFRTVSRVFGVFATGVLSFGATFATGLLGDFELTTLGTVLLSTSIVLVLLSLGFYAMAEWNVLSLRIFGEKKPTDFSLIVALLQLLFVIAAVVFLATFVILALQ